MPLPTPKIPLKDHCSVIHDGVLYTYQVDAFQSLVLNKGAQWTLLALGVPTTGSACVLGSVDGDAALIIVGGTASTSNSSSNATSSTTYRGLQHYLFKTSTWVTDEPADAVAMNRVNHGAAFLPRSEHIVIYGGSQNGNTGPSSQTFAISLRRAQNHATRAFSSHAPPVIKPLMLDYNATHALMVGGAATNREVNLFSLEHGWQEVGVKLDHGLADSSQVKAAILTGSNGGTLLETFDLTSTPNKVTSMMLDNATTSADSSRKRRSWSPSRLMDVSFPQRRQDITDSQRRRRQLQSLHYKRDVSLDNLPSYNDTLAPSDSRRDYSLATDPNTGLAVASGGGGQSVLAMFNETSNSWIDANQFFGDDSESSTGANAPSSSSSPASSSSPNSSQKSVSGGKIAAAILGAVFGLFILFMLVILAIRCCRGRREKKMNRRSESRREKATSPLSASDAATMRGSPELAYADKNKNFDRDADMVDNGAYMRESPHQRDLSIGNTSTIRNDRSALTTANSNKKALGSSHSNSPTHQYHVKGSSAESGHSFWVRAGRKSPETGRPQISKPIPQTSPGQHLNDATITNGAGGTRADNAGWSRYFAGGSGPTIVAGTGVSSGGPRKIIRRGEEPGEFGHALVEVPVAEGHPGAHTHDTNERDPMAATATNHRSIAQSSVYDLSSRAVSAMPHASAEVEPLNFRPSQLPLHPSLEQQQQEQDRAINSHLPASRAEGVSAPRVPPAAVLAKSPTPSMISDMIRDDRGPERESDLLRRSEGQESWTTPSQDRDSNRWTDERTSSYTVNSNGDRSRQSGGTGTSEVVSIPNFPMPMPIPSMPTSSQKSTSFAFHEVGGNVVPNALRDRDRDPSTMGVGHGAGHGAIPNAATSPSTAVPSPAAAAMGSTTRHERTPSGRLRAEGVPLTGAQRATPNGLLHSSEPSSSFPSQNSRGLGHGAGVGDTSTNASSTANVNASDLSWLNLGNGSSSGNGNSAGNDAWR